MKTKKLLHTEMDKKMLNVLFSLLLFLFFTSCIQCLNANSVGDGVRQATLWEDEEVQQEGSTVLSSYYHLGPGDPLLLAGRAPARVLKRMLHC